MSTILDWARPDRVAPLLAPGLNPATAASLLASQRLRSHTLRWLASRLGDATAEDGIGPAERTLLAQLPRVLDRICILAGAVWHAPRIRGLVMAADITAFIELYGAQARAIALACTADRPAIDAVGALDAVLKADGLACVQAWVAALPPPVAARASLALPPDDAVTDGHRLHGATVMRLVAREWHA